MSEWVEVVERAIADEVESLSEKPCACGKSPEGAPQKIVGKLHRRTEHDHLLGRCVRVGGEAECQKCKLIHPICIRVRMIDSTPMAARPSKAGTG